MWLSTPFLYAPWPLMVACAAALVVQSWRSPEFCGTNLAYSGPRRQRSRMLISYTPLLDAALAPSFAVTGTVEGARAQLLAAHFLKLVLEVLLVNRYNKV
ncbi:unnamed protein product [Urochloa humidicola]